MGTRDGAAVGTGCPVRAGGCQQLDPPCLARSQRPPPAAAQMASGVPPTMLRPRFGAGRDVERCKEVFAEEELSGEREIGLQRAGEGREGGCSGQWSMERLRGCQLTQQRGSRLALGLT